jgi:hypothetical protein
MAWARHGHGMGAAWTRHAMFESALKLTMQTKIFVRSDMNLLVAIPLGYVTVIDNT